MTNVHVIRLVGEVEGERQECYQWTFDGPTTGAAAAAFVGSTVTNEELARVISSGKARWRLECSCRWESAWRSKPSQLWTIGLFHQLATAP